MHCQDLSDIRRANRTLATCFALLFSIFFGGLSYRFIENRYRIRGGKTLPLNYSLLRAAGVIVLTPLLILSVKNFGADNMYWDLARNPETPIAAWELDKNCPRITSSIPCIYPVKHSKGQIILIGDSHAGALSQSFIDATHSRGFTAVTMTMASCQFIQEETVKGTLFSKLRDVYSIVWAGNPRTCFQENKEIINYLKYHKVDTVIVSQRSTAIEETVFASSFREDKYLSLIGRNLVSLKSLANSVILVGPVPEFPDRQKLFGERLVWQGVYAPPKSFLGGEMLQDSFKDQLFYNSHTTEWGIQYIDSTSQFCTSAKCSRWDGTNWLYFDQDHLGIEGANLIQHLLVSVIAKVP